jgi:hypothetical protein
VTVLSSGLVIGYTPLLGLWHDALRQHHHNHKAELRGDWPTCIFANRHDIVVKTEHSLVQIGNVASQYARLLAARLV